MAVDLGARALLKLVDVEEVQTLQEHAVAVAPARVTTPATQVSFSKIMVATDFSPASERALEYAISISRRFGSKIYLSHVIILDGYPMIAPEIAAKTIDASRGEAEENFAKIVEPTALTESISHQYRGGRILAHPRFAH